MKSVVQRVDWAKVRVEPDYEAAIGAGLLVFLGVENGDTDAERDWMAKKIAQLRIFPDAAGKMNLSVKDIGGAILLISQFTLVGDCRKGNRPAFVSAAPPDIAEPIYNAFCESLKSYGITPVKKGVFGAHMDVTLHNDGPVTLILEKKPI